MLIVICGKPGSEYLPERNLSRTGWDETVEDVAQGQFSEISSIIHADLGRDVTDIVAREVANIWADRGEGISSSEREFLEYTIGIQAANKFRAMEAA